MLQGLLKFLFQSKNIISWWLSMTDVLHKKFISISLPISWGDHVVEHILWTWIWIKFFTCMFSFMIFINILRDLYFSFVVYKWKRRITVILIIDLWHFIFFKLYKWFWFYSFDIQSFYRDIKLSYKSKKYELTFQYFAHFFHFSLFCFMFFSLLSNMFFLLGLPIFFFWSAECIFLSFLRCVFC